MPVITGYLNCNGPSKRLSKLYSVESTGSPADRFKMLLVKKLLLDMLLLKMLLLRCSMGTSENGAKRLNLFTEHCCSLLKVNAGRAFSERPLTFTVCSEGVQMVQTAWMAQALRMVQNGSNGSSCPNGSNSSDSSSSPNGSNSSSGSKMLAVAKLFWVDYCISFFMRFLGPFRKLPGC